MPEPLIQNSLLINEIFSSAQGEGLRFGLPSVFIRLSGCSLRCSYCDTVHSWTDGKRMTLEEILEEVISNQWPVKNLIITGGEPCEQDIQPLIESFKGKGFFLSLETNGTHKCPDNLDWVTVAPKDVSNYFIDQSFKGKVKEIKLVVTDNLNQGIIKKIVDEWRDVPILLQPNAKDQKPFTKTHNLYSEAFKIYPSKIRLGMQLHRIYGIE